MYIYYTCCIPCIYNSSKSSEGATSVVCASIDALIYENFYITYWPTNIFRIIKNLPTAGAFGQQFFYKNIIP